MIRPCFLVIDREFPGSISTRKLVLETAKFNVLTAYSGLEGLQMFRRFPALDGVVMDGELKDVPPDELVQNFKAVRPDVPIVVISPLGDGCASADYNLESYHPAKLLETLRGLKPRESDEIEKREEDLSRVS